MRGIVMRLCSLVVALTGAAVAQETAATVAHDGVTVLTAAEPPITCRIQHLVAGDLSLCAALDLSGNALHSNPASGGENATVLSGNQTLGLLVRVLNDGASRGGPPKLTSLMLSGSTMLAQDVAASELFVSTVAPAMRGLSSISLDGCGLTGLHVDALANATLVRGTPLRTLSLARNDVGADGAAAIARQLVYADGLATLQLSGTGLGASGAASLADSLSRGGGASSSLVHLALDQNAIGDGGAAALGDALAKARGGVLQTLDLSGNAIGPTGAARFARALAAADDASLAAGLRELHLSSNNVGAEGTIALAAAVERRVNLHTLSLHDNAIPREGGEALARALRGARALSRVTGVRHNDAWPADTAGRIEAAVASNADALARAGADPLLAEARQAGVKG
jgi:hypothetical protein